MQRLQFKNFALIFAVVVAVSFSSVDISRIVSDSTAGSVFAQQPAAQPQTPGGPQFQTRQPRPLAAGVLNVVPTTMDVRDSYSNPLSLPGLAADQYQPRFLADKETLHGSTRTIVLYRDIWQYEFSFLGLRQMKVVEQTADGPVEVNVWYMVYRIRNFGNALTYDQVTTQFQHTNFELRRSSTGGWGSDGFRFAGEPTRDKPNEAIESGSVAELTGARSATAPPETEKHFIPRFSLEGWVEESDDQFRRIGYRDLVRPEIVKLIQQREDPDQPLLNTVEMSKAEIPVAQSDNDPGVWGVAVWVGVEPRIDYVSVVASGLTNAYRLQATDDGTLARRHRMLQMNFWRPGDSARENDDFVHFGIPLQDNPAEQIQICLRYNLPGPLLRGYWRSPEANQDVLVVEADARVNLNTLDSALTPALDGQGGNPGQLPPEIAQAFADAGVDIPANAPVTVEIQGRQWVLADAEGRQFIIKLEPVFWDKDVAGGIRFIKNIDHLWIYRPIEVQKKP